LTDRPAETPGPHPDPSPPPSPGCPPAPGHQVGQHSQRVSFTRRWPLPVAGVVGRWPVGSSWASFGVDVGSDSAEQADVSLCAGEMWARSCSSTRRPWPRNRSTARPRYSVIPGTHAVRPAPRPRTHRGSTPDPPSCQHNHHGRSRPRLNRAPGPSVELWRCFRTGLPGYPLAPGRRRWRQQPSCRTGVRGVGVVFAGVSH
jgi:hypothetical protein